jgi:pilus assembly protein Flp/PilA
MLGLVNRAIVAIQLRELRRDEGQAMVEYALILALVSVVAIGALKLVGADIKSVFNNIDGKLSSAL